MFAAEAGAKRPGGAGSAALAGAGANGCAWSSEPPKSATTSVASVATATWNGSVKRVISSTRTPVKFATHTFCVLVGSQTFCTWTTAITAATSVAGGRMPKPASTVYTPMPTPKGLSGPRYSASGLSRPKSAT